MLQTIGKMGIFFLWNHIRSLRSKTVPAGSDKALRRSDFVSRWVWWCWWRGGLVYGDYWSVVTSAWPIDHWILKILQKFEKLKKKFKKFKMLKWSYSGVGVRNPSWPLLNIWPTDTERCRFRGDHVRRSRLLNSEIDENPGPCSR